MTDVDKIAFAVGWYELRQCPGCFAPLEDVAGIGRGHFLPGHKISTRNLAYRRTTVLGETFDGGSLDTDDPRVCDWSADDLAALVHIGSGLVKYDRGTAGTNRPAVGETAPSRENFPDPGCFVDLPLSGRGPTRHVGRT